MDLIKLSSIEKLNITNVRKMFINDIKIAYIVNLSSNLYKIRFICHQDLFDEYFRVDVLFGCDDKYKSVIDSCPYAFKNLKESGGIGQVMREVSAIPATNKFVTDFITTYSGDNMYCTCSAYRRTDVEHRDLFKNVKTYEHVIMKMPRDIYIKLSAFFGGIITSNTINCNILVDPSYNRVNYIPLEKAELIASSIVANKEPDTPTTITSKFTGTCGPKQYHFVYNILTDRPEDNIELHIPLPYYMFKAEYGKEAKIGVIEVSNNEILLVANNGIDTTVYILKDTALEKSAFADTNKIFKIKENKNDEENNDL
jgi:hypothetical protein